MRVEAHGRVEGSRGWRGLISPREEMSNETGKVVVAHDSGEFCVATPICLVDEPKNPVRAQDGPRPA